MKVFLGNYVLPSDPEAYKRQRDVIKQAVQTYQPDHIAGITVGNEFMLK
jgi:exo-beta-1,3-glucanase (GH17 family)